MFGICNIIQLIMVYDTIYFSVIKLIIHTFISRPGPNVAKFTRFISSTTFSVTQSLRKFYFLTGNVLYIGCMNCK